MCSLVAAIGVESARAETLPRAVSEFIKSETPTEPRPGEFPDQEAVAELIDQLGSDRYVERRSAEQALLDRGIAVFDQVDAAATHVDPEVAASCRYVLTQLTIPWARRDDPPEVKAYLTRYGMSEPSQRMQCARALAELPEGMGMSALVRIVRYDVSPEVSAYAAMYLLRRDDLDATWNIDVASLLRHEAGASVRPSVEWVRALATQLESPRDAESAWAPLIEQFQARLDDPSYDETAQQQYQTLLWNLFRLRTSQQDWSGAGAVIEDLISASPAESNNVFRVVLYTAVERKAWELVDFVVDKHRDQLERAKEPLYWAAHARWEQGQRDDANRLAESALAAPAPDGEGGLSTDTMQIAFRLARQNHVDWARREFEVALEAAPDGSPQQAFACWWLADSLHDTQEDDRAAEVLGKLANVLRNDPKSSMNYRRMQSRNVFGSNELTMSLPSIDEVFSKEKYYLACHEQAQGHRDKQLELLQEAFEHDEGDADTLIAIYRATEPDSKDRADIVKKIEALAQSFADGIDREPDSPSFYNQWAWLISNTEGDYDKAVRYSLRSLELAPDTAGYLDTLGRCYFAAGDVENAIKHQRRAVELEPSMQVLRRQLEEFEAAQKSRQASHQSDAA